MEATFKELASVVALSIDAAAVVLIAIGTAESVLLTFQRLAIAAIRTVLNYFLERDISEYAVREAA